MPRTLELAALTLPADIGRAIAAARRRMRSAITYGQHTPVPSADCRSFDPAHQEVIMNRIHRWLADHGR
jgi:hypothetical protein